MRESRQQRTQPRAAQNEPPAHRQREEAAVPQPRENSSPDDLYPHLDLGFVLRMMWACRRYGGAVMTGEIRVGAVDHRFVEARPRDAGLEIVAVMCRPALCGRAPSWPTIARVRRSFRPHKFQSEVSQFSKAASSRHTGLRGNAAEAATGASQASSAASFERMLISA
jgi:hypothetical protein